LETFGLLVDALIVDDVPYEIKRNDFFGMFEFFNYFREGVRTKKI